MVREGLRKRISFTTAEIAHLPVPLKHFRRAPENTPTTSKLTSTRSKRFQANVESSENPATDKNLKSPPEGKVLVQLVPGKANLERTRQTADIVKNHKDDITIELMVGDTYSTLNMSQLSPSKEKSTDSSFTQSEAAPEAEEEQHSENWNSINVIVYMGSKRARDHTSTRVTDHVICDDDYENFPDNELLFFERKEKYRRIRAKEREADRVRIALEMFKKAEDEIVEDGDGHGNQSASN
jgi:hypothetical protein